MEALIRALASRQPPHVEALMIQPTAVSPSELNVDVRYQRNGWVILKHYHVEVTEERVAIALATFQIKRIGQQ